MDLHELLKGIGQLKQPLICCKVLKIITFGPYKMFQRASVIFLKKINLNLGGHLHLMTRNVFESYRECDSALWTYFNKDAFILKKFF